MTSTLPFDAPISPELFSDAPITPVTNRLPVILPLLVTLATPPVRLNRLVIVSAEVVSRLFASVVTEAWKKFGVALPVLTKMDEPLFTSEKVCTVMQPNAEVMFEEIELTVTATPPDVMLPVTSWMLPVLISVALVSPTTLTVRKLPLPLMMPLLFSSPVPPAETLLELVASTEVRLLLEFPDQTLLVEDALPL